MEKSEKDRQKKRLKLKKIKKLRTKLNNLEQILIKKGAIDNTLITFIKDLTLEDKQTRIWKNILCRENLSPSDYYEISKAIDNAALREKAQEEYVKKASSDDLVETLKYEDSAFQEMAWQELYQRISKGKIKKRQARQILFSIFSDVKAYRKKVLDVLLCLEPSDKDLQSLLDLPFMSNYNVECSGLRIEIQNLIRNNKREKSANLKLIAKIEKIKEEIAKLKEE